MNQIIILIIGVILGGIAGWLIAAARSRAALSEEKTAAANQKIEAEGRIKATESTISELRAAVGQVQSRLDASGEELRKEATLRVAAETRLKETQANLEEQKRLLEQAEARLADTFQALSSNALKSNNQAFIELAGQAFQRLQAAAKGDLETREKAIEGLVNPLKDSLKRYEEQIQAMEKTRQNAYGSLDEQLRNLANLNQQLQKETGTLANALKGGPQVRGRWGELTLRRVAELAGMSEHCDFNEQESFETDSGRLRPDMIVNLPGGRRIAVDAKVPLQSFLDAAAATSEETRRVCLEDHGKRVRNHMNQLAARAYWDQFDPAPEIVVLFLPGESFFSAALEQDRTLIEDGMQKRVVLATPTTLIALLHAVAFGWRQERIAENAQQISDHGKDLYDRIRSFLGHFEGVGSSLKRAAENYNRAVGSLESRVLPSARRFKELGAATGGEIRELESVDESPRSLAVPERPDVE